MGRKKRVLSLFSCGGGMDIGFEGGFTARQCSTRRFYTSWGTEKLPKNDFETVFANDIEPKAKEAWVNYFKKTEGTDRSDRYHVGSIVDLVKRHRNGETDVFPDDIDVVTGGFPCQDFSVSGKRNGFDSQVSHDGGKRHDDQPSVETRGQLYMWMKEVIEITKPKVFVAENVKGLTSLNDVKDIIKKDFESVGYHVFDPQVLHSGNYGVPQTRERVIFIGLRIDALTEEARGMIAKSSPFDEFSPYPMPTHFAYGGNQIQFPRGDKMDAVTLSDAFSDLNEPENEREDLSQMHYSKAKFQKGTQGNSEVKMDSMGPTIRSEHHGNIEFRRLSEEHGGKNWTDGGAERRLTLRECARIQSFPDEYDFVIKNGNGKFSLSPSVGYKLVGNAVPPLMAYRIAEKINRNWKLYFGEE